MPGDERALLIHRTSSLRRLFEMTSDSLARAAINAEIAKHEVRITELDNEAPEELPAEEIVAKAPRDIIS